MHGQDRADVGSAASVKTSAAFPTPERVFQPCMSDLQRPFTSSQTVAAFPTSGEALTCKPAIRNSFQPPFSTNPQVAAVFGPPFQQTHRLQQFSGLHFNKPDVHNSFRPQKGLESVENSGFVETRAEKVRKKAGLRRGAPRNCGKRRVCGRQLARGASDRAYPALA